MQISVVIAILIAPPSEPNLDKVRAYIESRRAEDGNVLNSQMLQIKRSFQRARAAKLPKRTKRKLLGNIRTLHESKRKYAKRMKLKSWIPPFDFLNPTVHAIGRIRSGDNLSVRMTPREILGANEVLVNVEIYVTTFTGSRRRIASTRARKVSGRFWIQTPTKQLVVGRVMPLDAVFYVSASKDQTWKIVPFDARLLLPAVAAKKPR